MSVSLVFINSFSKNVLNEKAKVKIDSAASTGSRMNYMKYVSFLWPPVVAAQAMHSGGSYWL